jgi:hypothetical protein
MSILITYMTMMKLNGSYVLLKDNMLICLINQLGQKDQVELNLGAQINKSRSTSTQGNGQTI